MSIEIPGYKQPERAEPEGAAMPTLGDTLRVEQDSDRLDFMHSLQTVSTLDPGTYRKASAAGRKLDLPADVLYRNKEKLDESEKSTYYGTIFDDYRKTANALRDGNLAAVSQDDLENLKLIEGAAQDSEFNKLSGGEKVFNAIMGQVAQMGQGSDLSKIRDMQRIGVSLDAVDSEVAAAEAEGRQPYEGKGGPTGFAFDYLNSNPEQRLAMRERLGGQQLKQAQGIAQAQQDIEAQPIEPGARQIQDLQTNEQIGIPLGGTEREIVEGLGASSFDATMQAIVENPGFAGRTAAGAVVSSAPMLVAGAFGGLGGAAAAGYGTEYDVKFSDVLREAGVDFNSPKAVLEALQDDELMATARSKATRKAAATTAVDTLGIFAAGRLLAPTKFAGRPLSDGQREMVNLAAQFPVQGLSEAAGEAAGQLAAEGKVDAGEVLLEGVAGAAGSSLDVLAFGGGGLAERINTGLKQSREARAGAKSMTAAADAALASKLRTEDPDSFHQLVTQQLADSPMQTVWLPAEALQRLNQSSQVDIPAILAKVPGLTEQYADAVARGGSISMTGADYLTYLADYNQQLSSSVRLTVDGMSTEDSKAWTQQQEEQIGNVAEEFAKGPDAQAAAHREVMGELIQAGFRRQDAEQYAALHLSVLNNLAERTGQALDQLRQDFPLDIRTKAPDQLRAIPVDDARLAIQRLRSGDIPKAGDMFGKSISEYLRDSGGLNDEGGELAALDADVGKVGRNRLARKDGRSLDDAAMAAWENGYFPGVAREDVTPQLIVDAVRDEMGGKPRYSAEQENATLRDQAALLNELSDHFGKLGLDINELSDDEALAVLRGDQQPDAQGQRLEQFAGPTAWTADGVSLNEAKARLEQGDNPEQVRKETGWFQGTDGRWRFEIDDSTAQFKPLDSWVDRAEQGDGVTLADVLDHPALLAAYPELGQVEVRVNPERQGGGMFAAQPGRGIAGSFIEIGDPTVYQEGDPPALDIRMHEIQHAIQAREGFATGGSPDVLRAEKDQALADRDYWSTVSSLRVEAERNGGDYEQAARDLTDIFERAITDQQMQDAQGAESSEAIDQRVQMAEKVMRTIGNPTSTYKRLAGEVEARNTESRRTMTADERRAASPEQTADTPGDQAIVWWNGTEMNSASVAEQAAPADTRLNQSDLERLAGMSEDDYIAAVNPTGKRTAEDDIVIVKAGDLSVPADAQPVSELTDKKGNAVQIVADEQGILYAVQDGQAVGQIENQDGETLSIVVEEAQGRGIGAALAAALVRRDPFAPAGSFSPAGEAARRSAFRTVKAEQQQRLNQGANDDDARGFITFTPRGQGGRKFQITLGEKRDLSTLVHELGHFYLEVMQDVAASETAPEQIKNDVNLIRSWVGAEEGAELTVDQHEQFARGFEHYLAEGKAPSPELAAAFARFKRWLISIYKDLRRLNVELTDDVRKVFDRLVASDEQIMAAEQVANAIPLFKDAQAAGMTEQEFTAYQDSIELAHTHARDSIEEEIVRDEDRRRSKWWREELDNIRTEVGEEVDLQPEYAAIKALRSGEMPDGSEGTIKLNSAELSERYGKPVTQRMAFMHSRTGIPLDMAASMLGFESGDALVKAIMGALPRNMVVQDEATRRMEERHGTLRANGESADKAQAAIHNERRADVLAKELRRLAQVGNRKNITSQQILKEAARRVMSERKVRDIQPAEYQRAEAKASRETFQAFTKGDFDAAYQAKQRQLLNFYLYREAVKARAEIDGMVTKLNTYNRNSIRQRIGKAGGDFLDQIDAVMEQYEFRNVSLRQLDKRKTFGEWYNDQVAAGNDPVVPEFILNSMGRTNYKELSLAQLQELDEFVAHLDHLSKLKGKLQANKKVKDQKEAESLLIRSMVDNLKRQAPRALNDSSRTLPQAMGDWLAEGNSSLMKLEQIIEQADGGDPNGAWSTIWWQPLAEAQGRRDDLNRKITKEILDATQAWFDAKGSKAGQRFDIPGVGSLDYNGLLAVALNSGNASNLKKLLTGNKLSEASHADIIGRLDKDDWQYVQNMWNTVESLWPEIVALEKQVNGVSPDKVEPTPITTQHGVVTGGYWPLVYDFMSPAYAKVLGNLGDLSPLNEQGGVRASTPKGHTKARIDGFAAPIVLDVTMIANHISGVIHDLTHRVAIADARKLITAPTVRAVMNERMGPFQAQQFVNVLDGIANDLAPGSAKGIGVFRRTMSALRGNAAVAWMGYSVTTMLNQFGGYAQAMDYFAQKGQRKDYMRAIAKFAMNPIAERAAVMELSAEMRNRSVNLDPAIRAATEQIIRVGEGRIGTAMNKLANGRDAIKRYAFVPMSAMQSMVDTPVWMAAYEANGGANSGSNGQDAIHAADRAVRLTQMAGGAKDLSPIQQNELAKFFLMVYGYASLLWNRNVDIARSGVRGVKERSATQVLVALERFVYLNVIPAILAGAVKGALPDGDDDDGKDKMGDTWPEYLAIQTLLSVTNGVPLARDAAAGLFSDFGYGGASPLGGGIDAAIKATNSSKSEALVTNMTSAVGMLTGLPSSQVNRATRTFYDVGEGEMEADALTIARGILFGPPAK